MTNIIRNIDGKVVVIELTYEEKESIYRSVKYEYLQTDITHIMEAKGIDINKVKIDEDVMNTIVDKYEDYLSDNSGWDYWASEAIDDCYERDIEEE